MSADAPLISQHTPGFENLLLFRLESQRFALRVDSVVRVVWMVSLTPLPAAPEIFLGLVNIHGTVVPVIDIRRRFGFPAKSVAPSDRLVVTRSDRLTVALAVDDVLDVINIPTERITAADGRLNGSDYVAGVAKLPDGIVLIHDVNTFLALDEEHKLHLALEQNPMQSGEPDAD